jgi:predicted nucleic acid-binding protein
VKTVFIDTGPLVALFRRRDQFHQWVKTVLSEDEFKFITCEPVLTETLFLTNNDPAAVNAISGMMDDNLLEVKSALSLFKTEVFHLMQKYHDQNTSLADISLLALYNDNDEVSLLTTESDFLVYRDSKGNPLNLISPYKA